jgi:hypothetical protein
VDQDLYYSAIDRMEKAGVNRDYIQGWIAGYMQNPRREEQRVNEAYDAGFEHGEGGDADSFADWKAA